jgi:hypothetical protein
MSAPFVAPLALPLNTADAPRFPPNPVSRLSRITAINRDRSAGLTREK